MKAASAASIGADPGGDVIGRSEGDADQVIAAFTAAAVMGM